MKADSSVEQLVGFDWGNLQMIWEDSTVSNPKNRTSSKFLMEATPNFGIEGDERGPSRGSGAKGLGQRELLELW